MTALTSSKIRTLSSPSLAISRRHRLWLLKACAWVGVLCVTGSIWAADGGLPGYVILPLSIKGRSNQACIRVSINGQPATLVLDTGASTTVLDSRFYRGTRKKGADISEDQLPPEISRKTSANGQSAEVGFISSMKAGAMDFGKGPVVVTDLSGIMNYRSGNHVESIDGVLGEDILHRYSALIDWRRRGVYFNVDPSKRMNPAHAFTSNGWTAIPMSPTNGRHFSVACSVDGKPVRLMVDTGAHVTSFNRGTIPLNMIYNRDMGGSMVHLASTAGTMNMLGSASTMYPARVDHFRIGSYEIQGAYVAVLKLPDSLVHEQSDGEGPMLGLLGAEVLASNNAVIDIAGSTLYLKPKSR